MRAWVALTRIAEHGVSLSVVDERGWGWTATETRRAQLTEWTVYRSADLPDGTYEPVEPFYSFLPDQSMKTYVTALDDVSDLERRSLIELANSFGSIDSLAVRATPEGRAFTENLQASRDSKQRRRSACRDAMLDWLYSADAATPPGVPRKTMMQDPRRSCFFAQPFSADDLDAAAAWLYRQGLVEGTMGRRAQGPVVLYLTESGVKCAEEFSSDANGYLQARQGASGPTASAPVTTSPHPASVTYIINSPVSGTNVANGGNSTHGAGDPNSKESGKPTGRDSDAIEAARIGGKYVIAAAIIGVLGTIIAAFLTNLFGLVSSNSPDSGPVHSASSSPSTSPQSSPRSSTSSPQDASPTSGISASIQLIRIAEPVDGSKNIPLNSNIMIDVTRQSVNRYVWVLVQLGNQVFPQGPCNNLSATETECAAVQFGSPSMGSGVKYIVTAVIVGAQGNSAYMPFVHYGFRLNDPPRISIISKSKPITIYGSEQPAK
jgi:hypothetical protein